MISSELICDHAIQCIVMRRLAEYEAITSRLIAILARETKFESQPGLDRILAENPKLVVVFNHSSPLSWLPAACLLTSHVCARGGGHRKPFAVMDRFFYSVPLLQNLAKLISQSERPLRFQEIVEAVQQLETGDLVVFPEGSNCFFGPSEQLQPFRSNRFIEIAVEARVPILICVHRGSEHWAKTVRVAPRYSLWLQNLLGRTVVGRFFDGRLERSGQVTIPMLPLPIEQFVMRAELHQPSSWLLPEAGPARSMRIESEARQVFEKMTEMLSTLA